VLKTGQAVPGRPLRQLRVRPGTTLQASCEPTTTPATPSAPTSPRPRAKTNLWVPVVFRSHHRVDHENSPRHRRAPHQGPPLRSGPCGMLRTLDPALTGAVDRAHGRRVHGGVAPYLQLTNARAGRPSHRQPTRPGARCASGSLPSALRCGAPPSFTALTNVPAYLRYSQANPSTSRTNGSFETVV
jgi:hypothetical protein